MNTEKDFRRVCAKRFGSRVHITQVGSAIALCGLRPVQGESGWGRPRSKCRECQDCKFRLIKFLKPPAPNPRKSQS